MKQAYKSCALAFGALLLLFLHFYKLGSVPGLHYDEAWAMNYAWRIANEPGFWPLTAMSPYTAPWAHYWAALWMKLLGPSVFVFRASQVFLSLGGIGFLALALPRGYRTAFLFMIAAVPALPLNHRFAIELTGFHVFAFGLLCWAISRKKVGVAVFAALLGTTAHILFYGVMLGLVAMVLLEAVNLGQRAVAGAMVYFGAMALFFLHVMLLIPERGKAAALVLSSVAIVGLLLCKGDKWTIWKSVWWKRALLVGAAVFFLNGIFFSEGSWSLAISRGVIAEGKDGLLVLTSALLYLCIFIWPIEAFPPALKTWLFSSFFFLGMMMLKPAPRYFELLFLGLAATIPFVGEKLSALKIVGPERTARTPFEFAVGVFLFLGIFAWKDVYRPYFRGAPI
ncbi:MAG TPA: hypothetical protein VIH99_07885, partial [Bdellovibrionota bacterium]